MDRGRLLAGIGVVAAVVSLVALPWVEFSVSAGGCRHIHGLPNVCENSGIYRGDSTATPASRGGGADDIVPGRASDPNGCSGLS